MLDASVRHEGEAEGARKTRARKRTPLEGKTLAMIFEKPSTRTRVSFDVGMRQLGGEVDHADRRRDAARPRRDHRRHRARAVALCRRHHDPDPQPRGAARTGRARHRARHQRADAAFASLPGDGGSDDVRGASRPDRGPHRRLERRRQQRAGVLGACGGAVQVQAECRHPAAARAEQGDAGLDQGDPGADRARQRSGSRRARRRLRRHRHLVLDGRQGRRASAQSAASPIRSMPS